jgi:hypothetical protein
VAKLVKKGEEVLEDFELDIAALRHAVIHRPNDGIPESEPTNDSLRATRARWGMSARGEADETSRPTSRVVRERSIRGKGKILN